MYIRGLIPLNFAALANAVPIGSRYLATKDNADFLKYERVRNEVNFSVKQVKIDYEKSMALNAKREPKNFWKYVNEKPQIGVINRKCSENR